MSSFLPHFFEETVLLDENSWLTVVFFVFCFLFFPQQFKPCLLTSWFLMRNCLLILLRILCIWQVATPLLLSGFSFIFQQFTMMWLWVGIFESILFGYCWVPWVHVYVYTCPSLPSNLRAFAHYFFRHPSSFLSAFLPLSLSLPHSLLFVRLP